MRASPGSFAGNLPLHANETIVNRFARADLRGRKAGAQRGCWSRIVAENSELSALQQ
jgi:hypothetical protein